jgi:hypothetical protein
MGAAHKLPISNSPTTSAKFQLTLRMCVPFPTLLLRVQLSYGCVWGGRVQGGCPSPACGRRRRRWRWAAGGGRACRPAAPPNGGGRSTAAAGCGNRCYGGGSSGARSVCVRQECAARRRSSRLVGWRAGGGLWRRCERRAWSPPLSVGRRGGSALCGGGREGSGRDDVARAVCGRRARRVHIAERDSASLTIATALA